MMEEILDKLEVTHVTAEFMVTLRLPPDTYIRIAGHGKDEFTLRMTVEGSSPEDARGRLIRLRAALTEALNA